MKSRLTALLSFFVLLCSAAQAADEVLVLKLGHGLDTGSSLHLANERAAELIELKSGGRIRLSIYPNSQLGQNREIIESVQAGVLDLCNPNMAAFAGFAPVAQTLDFPYLFNSNQEAERILDGEIGQELFRDMEEQEFVGLAFWSSGWRHVTTSKTEVRRPADMKGLKIRVMDSPIHLEHFRMLGANPIPMAYSEVLPALQQGAIDAQENPYINIRQAGFFEVQKFLIETGHVYDVCPVIFSKTRWDRLTPEQQSIIREAYREATAYQRELTLGLEKHIREEFEASGKIAIVRLSDEERGAFRDAVRPMYINHASRFPLARKILEAQGIIF